MKIREVLNFLWHETKEAFNNREWLPALLIVGLAAAIITVSAAGVLANIF